MASRTASVPGSRLAEGLVVAAMVVAGLEMLVAGVWAWLAPPGFLTANTLHALNHALDLHLGGHVTDAYALGVLSLLAGAALVLRVRQLRQPSANEPRREP